MICFIFYDQKSGICLEFFFCFHKHWAFLAFWGKKMDKLILIKSAADQHILN